MKKHIIRDKSRSIIFFLDVNNFGNIVGVNYFEEDVHLPKESWGEFMLHDVFLTKWIVSRLEEKGLLFFDRDADLNQTQLDVIAEGIYSYINYDQNPELYGWIEEEKVFEWEVPAKKPSIAQAFGQALNNAGFSNL